MEKRLTMFLQDNPFMVNTKNNLSDPKHLDKLKVEYKSKLFNQGGLSLEEILKAR